MKRTLGPMKRTGTYFNRNAELYLEINYNLIKKDFIDTLIRKTANSTSNRKWVNDTNLFFCTQRKSLYR
jgi:hypothetical protein